MTIKVIAIGNTLIGDDSIGIRVLEKIESTLNISCIETYIGETDFLYCISAINDCDFIFIIDAAMLEKEIGTINLIPLEEYRFYKNGYTQHSNSLLDLIYSYHKEVVGYAIGIEVDHIDYDLNLSKNLQLLLEDISLNVLNKIKEKLNFYKFYDTIFI